MIDISRVHIEIIVLIILRSTYTLYTNKVDFIAHCSLCGISHGIFLGNRTTVCNNLFLCHLLTIILEKLMFRVSLVLFEIIL